MQFIAKLEAKFGHFAIPGLIQIIVLFQLGVLLALTFMPIDAAQRYLGYLVFDANRILHGEVWRLVTDALILNLFFALKTTTGKILWGIITAQLFMMFGRGLEQAWGAFRVNLYILVWFIMSWVFGFIFGTAIDGMYLAQTILFAFAMLYPNEELMLFFILPVKMKWIALISAGMTVFMVMQDPWSIIMIVAGHLNFFAAFGPDVIKQTKHAAKVTDRRSRFAAAAAPAGAFFHQCSVCQKTEIDNPQLDFRVLASGDEICSDCRSKNAA